MSLPLAKLGENLINIRIALHIEIDIESHHAARRIHGIHVIQIINTAHLLFDRCGDGFFEGLGVSTGISGFHPDFRGNNIGKTFNRQGENGYNTEGDNDYGNNDSNNGAIDKKPGHDLPYLPFCA
ncbi:MAG: hypothetical protein A4E71_01077 [Smithella sp. PtaU1.Bin162]|nr:MAG: hypothetical protein A4E71_01077 [Smithella sp. PtaU1.Bin162]